MAIYSPYLFAFKLVEYPGKLACKRRWSETFGKSSFEAGYFLGRYAVLFYIPFLLMTILYAVIVFKVKKQKFPVEQSATVEENRTKRDKKVLKLAIAIVLGFTICWVPASIMILLKFFAWDGRLPCGAILSWDIILFMADALFINPCICVAFSSNYRQEFKRLLKYFWGMQN